MVSTILKGNWVIFGMNAPMPLAIAWPKVSFTCMNTAVRGAVLLGDLCDRGRGARVEGADQHVRALLDQPLGARARGVDVGLEVGVHELEVDAEHLLQHAGRKVRALLARLADEAEVARAREDHADAQLLRLRTHDSKG